MNKKDEALKKAIYTLEYIEQHIPPMRSMAYDAIKECKEALEQPSLCEDIGREALIDSKIEFPTFLYVSQCKLNGQINISSGPLTPNGERTYEYIGTLPLNRIPTHKKLLREYAKMPLNEAEINEIIKTIPELEEHMMFSVDHLMSASMKRRHQIILYFARAIEIAHRIGE